MACIGTIWYMIKFLWLLFVAWLWEQFRLHKDDLMRLVASACPFAQGWTAALRRHGWIDDIDHLIITNDQVRALKSCFLDNPVASIFW
jgi:hypothetical protein